MCGSLSIGHFGSANRTTSSSIWFGVLLLVGTAGHEFNFVFHATVLNRRQWNERPDNLFCHCIVVALEIVVGIFFSLVCLFVQIKIQETAW